jgi:hypothetical protein
MSVPVVSVVSLLSLSISDGDRLPSARAVAAALPRSPRPRPRPLPQVPRNSSEWEPTPAGTPIRPCVPTEDHRLRTADDDSDETDEIEETEQTKIPTIQQCQH